MTSISTIAVRLATIAFHAAGLALLVTCPARSADELRPEKVAEGVYAFVAGTGEISRANRGNVATAASSSGPPA